jgi:outer membrane protein OmpA-like peptidoglycan-associated protein
VAELDRAIAQTGSAAIYGVHFDTGSATLRPDSTAALENVLATINRRPDSHWVISGHTDNQGSADLNQKLSQSRAASVIAWLVSHGVAATRLKPQGFGATHPVADNSTEAGRALNRRVEMQLVQ